MQFTKLMVDNYELSRDRQIGYQVQLYPDDDHRLSASRLHFLCLVDNYTTRFFEPRRSLTGFEN